ncbi:Dot/Icm T4SS effector AnkK/LegA5 [Legionella hackeliae]|uniref:Putative Cardiac ankyrin repeat-containing protein K n=1 Tax=Legionella hackeliae TaxID=449 RepID=A0A0A8USW9_LEGHA|nr:Dot/Icm T4SS effector AnkK/LegA5 [Legionella hackeliae]KTD12431.1 cardiac ankyrin repeat-containing protein [Legionella hackeliae]CEK11843.1 putative Cardiac ankyrin repeat-containing protein K [Legionella hackeliae]STX48609.1 ankyrin [Legionella hackeliae]
MVQFYNYEQIVGLLDGSQVTRKSAHTVQFVEYEQNQKKVPIVYKENKGGKPIASVRETVFSELARLLMAPHLTPPQHIVINGSRQIVGTAVDNMAMSIAKREKIGSTKFYKIRDASYATDLTSPTQLSTDISFGFLNQMPGGFFAHLMKERDEERLSIDMESLASVLTCSYFLEEDDLHKGNIGYYVTEKDGKPHVTFFKIDHDLLLTDSITSFYDSRFQNLSNRQDHFNITRHDLLHFPDLRDSSNYYWPTRRRFVVKIGDDKIYSNSADRDAFKRLQADDEFNRYKWKHLLKSILIPDELVRHAILMHLESSNYQDLSEINLISQAMQERVSKLRAVLFSTSHFNQYLTSEDGEKDLFDCMQELGNHLNEITGIAEEVKNKILRDLEVQTDHYKHIAQQQPFSTDTPLHAAIRLGDYRFEKSHLRYVGRENGSKELPIDIAAAYATDYDPFSEQVNPSKDPFCVIKHLLQNGAKMTPKVEELLKEKNINIHTYQFNSQYLQWQVNNYSDLSDLITTIGSDNSLTLKTKKNITLQVVENHIHKLKPEELALFKIDLNGSSYMARKPEFLFISQLRSTFWFIRFIFGLYGNSSTKKELNNLIQNAQNTLSKGYSPYSFFSSTSSNSQRASIVTEEKGANTADDEDTSLREIP